MIEDEINQRENEEFYTKREHFEMNIFILVSPTKQPKKWNEEQSIS